jgi:protein-arginine kinase activator protein McsA
MKGIDNMECFNCGRKEYLEKVTILEVFSGEKEKVYICPMCYDNMFTLEEFEAWVKYMDENKDKKRIY